MDRDRADCRAESVYLMEDRPQPPARPPRRRRTPTPPHWADNILRFRLLGRGVIGSIGFLGVLLGISFTVIQLIAFLSPDPPKPEIESINLKRAVPGEEIVIAGKNLELVTEAHLLAGRSDEQIFFLPINGNKIMVNVPQGFAEGSYILEFSREEDESPVTAGNIEVIYPTPTPKPHPTATPGPQANDSADILPTIVPIPPALTPIPPTIIFANLNWDTARMQNAIARFIVENGYGYPTDTIPDLPGGAGDVWKSLVNGNINVYLELWLPNLREEWELALETGSVIPLGKSLDVTWQSGFVVPTYMIEGDPATGDALSPSLKTVHDLRSYAEVFALPDSDGKAVLWNCPPIWGCSKINEGQVRAYGLDDVIELRNPGSEEELFNRVLQANEDKLAWLGYMWSPTKTASTLSLTRLEEPSCDVGQNPEDGCGYDESRVRIAVHPSLVAEAADLVELFRKWDFKESTLFVAEECMGETGGDFEKAAVCYLKKEQAVWTQWVTTKAARKVREALLIQ